MSPVPAPNRPAPAHDHTATCLETDEDVMQALRANLAAAPNVPAPLLPAPTASAHAAPNAAPAALFGYEASAARASNVATWQPALRPPMAILTVFDDGKTDGEKIRLRDGRFVIGRTDGDLVIPHDVMISSRHLEITRQQVGGQIRWVITDLQSTNGLYVRVLRTALADRSEILVGKGRYQFSAPTA